MPINSSIALSGNNTPIPSARDIRIKEANLQGLLQNQEINKGILADNEFARQKRREDARKMKQANEIFQKYTNPDTGEVDYRAAQGEVFSAAGEEIGTQVFKQRMEIEKVFNNMNAEGLKRYDEVTKALKDVHSNIAGMETEEERQGAWQAVRPSLIQNGLLTDDPTTVEWDTEVFGAYIESLKIADERKSLRVKELERIAKERTLPDEETGLTPAEQEKKNAQARPLTKEQEGQEIRIRKSTRQPKASKEEEDYKFWQTLTRDANRALADANSARWEGDPLLTVPPGTELARLMESEEGAGVRLWGGGQKMPLALAQLYLKQAEGDTEEAMRMAMADGWDIRK